MPRRAKAYKFKRPLSQNQEPFKSENLYENYFSVALIHRQCKISVGPIVFEF